MELEVMTQMNVELFEDVKALIREEPRRLQMGEWISWDGENACQTAACIAGWSVIASRITNKTPEAIKNFTETVGVRILGIQQRASDLLVIDDETSWALFYTQNWPYEFVERWSLCEPKSKEAAEVACEVIDYLLEKFPNGCKFVRDPDTERVKWIDPQKEENQ